MQSILILIATVLSLHSCSRTELKVGDAALELEAMEWLQSPDLKMKEMKGKVVLMRWWTDGCGFCVQSADALNEWDARYRDSGLVVIGLYHPKPEPASCDPERVREFALEKGFRFPIAIDADWKNLKRYWVNGAKKSFTSVSFLIGRDGRIVHIHPGGEYHREEEEGHESCVRDFYEMDARIQKAIRSK